MGNTIRVVGSAVVVADIHGAVDHDLAGHIVLVSRMQAEAGSGDSLDRGDVDGVSADRILEDASANLRGKSQETEV